MRCVYVFMCMYYKYDLTPCGMMKMYPAVNRLIIVSIIFNFANEGYLESGQYCLKFAELKVFVDAI